MEDNLSRFSRGTQIAYIPAHANGDINHIDVEFGFVTSLHSSGEMAFCRFWSRFAFNSLRTKANSELALLTNLVPHLSKLQDVVDKLLEELP